MTRTGKTDDQYSEQEATQRREAALKRMLMTPHKPHKPLGKHGSKRKHSPNPPKNKGK